ncbi:phosphopantetheine adenylyltransferase [Hypnocyclicus thermotrophus]|uniref:Phosphopantetheine adenylyltransferase n=1 Tax=Hypnocyclicus thermotrophus TaxID=1627895 RepID=A0AA46DYT4_9FUSO|nr:pantetheine-phosphate adenylyltransferase [Hypnocyclicus thermotrophus]TDT70435.1 phosphopantetheine adenylyltransferase [Hypnocyclicus thermotrophus]
MEKKKAIYAGSFDPITKGHLDIIKRSSKIFDEVIVGVLNNSNKKYWFSLEQRENMIKKSLENEKIENIKIDSFEGLLVDFMNRKQCNILVRGLRAVSDYEYELQLALTNSVLSKNSIETIFLPASRENLYLSASIVKDIALNKGELTEFLPKVIIDDVIKKANEKR